MGLRLSTSVSFLSRAIIISGGPTSVNDADTLKYDPAIFLLNIPILGICYGLQLINKHFGGTVARKSIREDGQFAIKIDPSCEIFDDLEESQNVLLTHSDYVDQLAPCLRVTAQSGELVAGVAHRERKVFGVQFHPEVDLTEKGMKMMRNFLYNVSPVTVADFDIPSLSSPHPLPLTPNTIQTLFVAPPPVSLLPVVSPFPFPSSLPSFPSCSLSSLPPLSPSFLPSHLSLFILPLLSLPFLLPPPLSSSPLPFLLPLPFPPPPSPFLSSSLRLLIVVASLIMVAGRRRALSTSDRLSETPKSWCVVIEC